jgi:hypothetical protein
VVCAQAQGVSSYCLPPANCAKAPPSASSAQKLAFLTFCNWDFKAYPTSMQSVFTYIHCTRKSLTSVHLRKGISQILFYWNLFLFSYDHNLIFYETHPDTHHYFSLASKYVEQYFLKSKIMIPPFQAPLSWVFLNHYHYRPKEHCIPSFSLFYFFFCCVWNLWICHFITPFSL